MPWAFIQAMRRLTSAMTSGPMPSPASRSRWWAGMKRSLVARPARIAIGQRWVSQAACLEDDNGYRTTRTGWFEAEGGIRRSFNLIFRLWVGRRGRCRWNGLIAFGLLSLGFLGKFQPRRRQVQRNGLVLGVSQLNRQAI